MRAPKRFLLACFILISTLLNAQDEPVLRCISLNQTNDVLLEWSIPVDTGADFNSYIIRYRAGGTGPFNVLSQIPSYAQSSILIPGNFAGNAQFFIQQVYNGFADTSRATDTIRPIVVSIGSSGKKVSLSWNHIEIASIDSVYRVYKLDTGGVWQQIATVEYPGRTLKDSTMQCDEIVTYRVEYRGVGGCISSSNYASKQVVDQLAPKKVSLICASVDTATGDVMLEWSASESSDTYGYMVFYFEDFNRTDIVYGRFNNSLVYDKDGINGLVRPETLSVAPFDSCYDDLNNWYNQAADSLRFQTLFVDTIGFDRCAGTLGLKWTHPEGLALGVRNPGGFNVYRKVNNGPSVKVASLSSADSIFVDSGLISGYEYNYVVTAVDAVFGKEAMSNPVNFDLKALNAPEFLYISSVRNNHTSGKNVVHLYADSLAETRMYGLWRSLRPDSKFIEVAQFEATNASVYTFEDESGLAGQVPYYYQIAAYDRCGDVLDLTQTVKSIHLTGEKNFQDLMNTLYWDEYQGFDSAGSGVSYYELMRLTSQGQLDSLEFTPGSFMHEDDITTPLIINGSICYYVKALEASGNAYGLTDTSISNLLCLDYPPKVFIPNAFSPDADDLNDIFLPDVNYINPDQYILEVFDRMGNLVFRTEDPMMGWDGGVEANGVYAYRLRLSNAREEAIELTGKVHLLR